MNHPARHRKAFTLVEPPAVSRRQSKAFTLIELLAVMLVIGILVTIVVGVASQVTRKQAQADTKQTMVIVMQAIDVYYEEYGAYPDLVPDPDDKVMGAELYTKLWSNTRCRQRLLALNPKATLAPGGNAYLVDGFDEVLRYRSGGLGGTPYLESCGADADFGSDQEPEAKEDNIRSDRL